LTRSFAVCFLFLISASSLAQSLTGKVRDKKSPLEGATVVVLTENNRTVAYCITNETGSFRLNIPQNSSPKTINISYIGYKQTSIPFKDFKNGQTVILEDGSFAIREVKVKSQRLKSEGDTLTYSVSGFRQPQDRTIADVIAKMPGIEVKSDGQVEYQGKAINKFYIEGLDLMGSQYGVANKNISADMVKNVQVMRHHQPVKSLRGVTFSEQAALNLVLHDDAKAIWNGTADIGTGYGDDFLYSCRVMGLRFDKTFQTLMMYKNDNTGNDIAQELKFLGTNKITLQSSDQSGMITMPSAKASSIDKKRYTFNKTHLAAGNWLWKTGKDSELRLQSSAIYDDKDISGERKTTYLTIDGLPVITETQEVGNTYTDLKAEAKYQHNGAKTYINNKLSGKLSLNKGLGQEIINDNVINQNVRLRQQSLSNDLQISITTDKKNVYEINSIWNYYYLPGQLLTINGRTEKLNLNMLAGNNYIKNKLKVGKYYYIDNQLGIDVLNEGIGLGFDSEAEEKHSYRLIQPYWRPAFSMNFPSHRINAAVRLSYANQRYRESKSNEQWAEPSLSWNWDMSSMSELSSTIRYDASPLDGYDICDMPVFTNYQTIEKSSGKVKTQRRLSFIMAYKYTNPIKGIFINIRPFINRSTGNIMYTSELDSLVYSVIATDRDYSMLSRGGSTRLSKALGWAKTNVGISTSLTVSDYKMLVNDDVDDARMYKSYLTLDISMRPMDILSVEGKSTMQYTHQKNISRPAMSSEGNYHWRHSLNFFLLPADAWIISLENEFYHNSSKYLGSDYFLDLGVRYKSRRWELEFIASNIFGRSQFESHIVSTRTESYRITHLRPREFLLKWSFDM